MDDRLTHSPLEQTAQTAVPPGAPQDDYLTLEAAARELGMLDLDTTAVTGAGLVHLRELQNLHTLNLWDTQVGDAGLQHLRSLVRLEDLNLRNTRISDQAVADLAALTSLKRLDLTETRIRAGAVAYLREELPECAITAPS